MLETCCFCILMEINLNQLDVLNKYKFSDSQESINF